MASQEDKEERDPEGSGFVDLINCFSCCNHGTVVKSKLNFASMCHMYRDQGRKPENCSGRKEKS